jgi:hypothetical protein
VWYVNAITLFKQFIEVSYTLFGSAPAAPLRARFRRALPNGKNGVRSSRESERIDSHFVHQVGSGKNLLPTDPYPLRLAHARPPIICYAWLSTAPRVRRPPLAQSARVPTAARPRHPHPSMPSCCSSPALQVLVRCSSPASAHPSLLAA